MTKTCSKNREKIVDHFICKCGYKIHLSDPEWDDYNEKYWYKTEYHVCKDDDKS